MSGLKTRFTTAAQEVQKLKTRPSNDKLLAALRSIQAGDRGRRERQPARVSRSHRPRQVRRMGHQEGPDERQSHAGVCRPGREAEESLDVPPSQPLTPTVIVLAIALGVIGVLLGVRCGVRGDAGSCALSRFRKRGASKSSAPCRSMPTFHRPFVRASTAWCSSSLRKRNSSAVAVLK